MTTRNFSTIMANNSDSAFRTWCSEYSDALTHLGLPKAGDTGQIDLSTVARPLTSVAAGYEIRYLNDALHATAPIYLKIEFGTSSPTSLPALWVTIGTGSDGSGAITGVIVPRRRFDRGGSYALDSANPYPSYGCRVGGQFAFSFKSGISGASGAGVGLSMLLIARSVNSSGADTAEGVTLIGTSNASANWFYSHNFSSGLTAGGVGASFATSFVPHQLAATLVGGDVQAFKHYGAYPDVRAMVCCVTVRHAEVPVGSTFVVAPVGVAGRTYLSVGQAGRACTGNANSADYSLAILWE